MKNKKYILLLIVVGFLAVSCSDFLDVNTDPNNPEDVPPNLILPAGLGYTAYYIIGPRMVNHLGNMMMYNFGEARGYSWYGTEFKYSVTAEFYDPLWDYTYSNALKQYELLVTIDLKEKPKYGYYKAIGLIMEAFHFQMLVDLYGDIPYSGALKRASNPTPKYDKAAAVYDSLLVDLSKAINIIDKTSQLRAPVKPGSDDIMFGGNMTKWKKFANTLKIRIVSRASDVWDKSKINGVLANIQSSGVGYITDEVTINPGYKQEANKLNHYWANFATDENGSLTNTHKATAATQFVIEYFKATSSKPLSETRYNRIFEIPASGAKGVNQGYPNNDESKGPNRVSNMRIYHIESGEQVFGGGVLKGPGMDAVVFTLAEHKFNMAELALEGFDVTKSPKAYYKEGVIASFTYLGLSASDATAYLSQSNMWANLNKLNAIMTQQWIATMGVTAAQAWFDYNRTGYPNGKPYNAAAHGVPVAPTGFPISADAGNVNDRPVRLHYPQSEITTNSANIPDQPDVFSEKIFWAK